MDTLDEPIKLSYNHGKLFPPNAVVIGYVLIGISIFSLLMGNWILAIILILLGLLTAFSWHGIEIQPEDGKIVDHTSYFGFIKIKKILEFNKWSFITVIPVKSTQTVYSRSISYVNLTDYYFMICLLNQNYRNKKELMKFESKNTGEDTAKKLSYRLGMEYFEYNPQVIRNSFRR